MTLYEAKQLLLGKYFTSENIFLEDITIFTYNNQIKDIHIELIVNSSENMVTINTQGVYKLIVFENKDSFIEFLEDLVLLNCYGELID